MATTTIAPARRCAYAVLRRTFEQGAYTDRALRSEAQAYELDGRDRALAMRLASGAVQRRATLDHFIEQLAERPPARLDAAVLAALRLGVYELLYLGGAPDRAVVADAVELAKSAGSGGHGLVNAVLRRAAREGAQTLLATLSDVTPEQATIKHSHPLWVARMWWEYLGPVQTRTLMAYDNEPGEVAPRANTLAIDPDQAVDQLGVATHRDAALPEAIVLDAALDLHGSPLWQRGALVAQSRAAMLVSRALAPLPGERVLDLCAAPGGKATHLAALMGGAGEVVAVERDPRRASVLRRAAARLGADNVRVVVADARERRPDPETYDRVLVDPPCSGLGTLQARPDLRWRVDARAAGEMARAGEEILKNAATALRPGGVLVYSTCTISPMENEQVIGAFLDSHPGFGFDDLGATLGPDPARLRTPGWPDEGGAALTLPHRDRTAGFFFARLRRA
ncbi:MAG TPA: 16S rRNA (cytosine(967)-C(5))-methyltransferase RsmB [Solirubrobacteraceae bacterium]|nr:16S rRNA (cytosine(967)-C(5))-methyltransferase RsmB [Solirubrobacteraceae bacterium]